LASKNILSCVFFLKKCSQHEGNGIFASEHYYFAVYGKFKKKCVRAKN